MAYPLPLTHPELKKRKLEQESLPHDTQKKLKTLQTVPLEENMDYVALQSALELLQARMVQIHGEIKELVHFKNVIKQTSGVKEATKLITNNSDYLKEIHYKGCYAKCPVVNWERDYGLDMKVLTTHYGSSDISECYETINEQYEIIKRDKLFN